MFSAPSSSVSQSVFAFLTRQPVQRAGLLPDAVRRTRLRRCRVPTPTPADATSASPGYYCDGAESSQSRYRSRLPWSPQFRGSLPVVPPECHRGRPRQAYQYLDSTHCSSTIAFEIVAKNCVRRPVRLRSRRVVLTRRRIAARAFREVVFVPLSAQPGYKRFSAELSHGGEVANSRRQHQSNLPVPVVLWPIVVRQTKL